VTGDLSSWYRIIAGDPGELLANDVRFHDTGITAGTQPIGVLV
jgi:hypothetical protein